MTTEYRMHLDRGACDGIFACLVRDDRFAEAADGLAMLDAGDAAAESGAADHSATDAADTQVVTFRDDRREAAEQAARACPVDAIEVLEGAGDG